jgi:hypothetical protein
MADADGIKPSHLPPRCDADCAGSDLYDPEREAEVDVSAYGIEENELAVRGL